MLERGCTACRKKWIRRRGFKNLGEFWISDGQESGHLEEWVHGDYERIRGSRVRTEESRECHCNPAPISSQDINKESTLKIKKGAAEAEE